MVWQIKSFEELTTNELYQIFHLRIKVFIVEQNCPYQDADFKDQKGFHLMCWSENKLVAYTRLLPPGISYSETSIGRVVTDPDFRNKKLGKELMQRSIDFLEKKYPNQKIRISAQTYLLKFYSDLGFHSTGKEYLEDDIPHTEMLK